MRGCPARIWSRRSPSVPLLSLSLSLSRPSSFTRISTVRFSHLRGSYALRHSFTRSSTDPIITFLSALCNAGTARETRTVLRLIVEKSRAYAITILLTRTKSPCVKWLPYIPLLYSSRENRDITLPHIGRSRRMVDCLSWNV